VIIVLGTRDDPHVEWVTSELQGRHIPYVILDHGSPPSFKITSSENASLQINVNDLPIEPTVIWDRSKLFLNFYSGDQIRRNHFVRTKEWLGLYETLRALYSDRTYPPHDKIKLFSNKPIQSIIAKSCGFRVPPFMISNSKNELQVFSES